MGVLGFGLDLSLFELLSQYLFSLFHLLLDLFGRQPFGFQFLLEFHALNHNFPFPLVLHNFLIGFPGRSHTSFSFFLKFLQKLFLAVSFLLIQADVGLNVTRSAWASGGLQADTVVHLLYKNYINYQSMLMRSFSIWLVLRVYLSIWSLSSVILSDDFLFIFVILCSTFLSSLLFIFIKTFLPILLSANPRSRLAYKNWAIWEQHCDFESWYCSTYGSPYQEFWFGYWFYLPLF